MNIGLQMPPEMMDAAIVSRVATGSSRQTENGYEAVPPAREHAGLSPEAAAAVSAGMSRDEAKAGAEALRETAGQKDPLTASLGSELKGAGIDNMQDKSHIEPAQTGMAVAKKSGPDGHSV
jgi:hypothetical protein